MSDSVPEVVVVALQRARALPSTHVLGLHPALCIRGSLRSLLRSSLGLRVWQDPTSVRCSALPAIVCGTTAFADCCRCSAPSLTRLSSLTYRRLSPGKNVDLHRMSPPHLRLHPLVVPDFVLFCKLVRMQTPHADSCSSARGFAAAFLPIPPRGGHFCPWLVVATTRPHRELSPPSQRPCRRTAKDASDLLASSMLRRRALVLSAC